MSTKDDYQQSVEARLREWKSEIEEMRVKADRAEADAKSKYEAEIAKLEQHRREAEAKLDELREASDHAWEDVRSGIESALDSLGDSVKRARDRFQ